MDDLKNIKLTDLAIGSAFRFQKLVGLPSRRFDIYFCSHLFCFYEKRERFLQQKPDSWNHGIAVLSRISNPPPTHPCKRRHLLESRHLFFPPPIQVAKENDQYLSCQSPKRPLTGREEIEYTPPDQSGQAFEDETSDTFGKRNSQPVKILDAVDSPISQTTGRSSR
jgi:hypothetical protein